MSDQPLVSVLFPTYQRGELALQALSSVLVQDYDHLEVVVTDNGADEMLRRYIDTLGDARVQYHRNPANLGVGGNYNRALDLATGDLLHVFSDDDVMNAGCIRRKVEVFQQEPGVVFVHSACEQLDEYSQVTDPWRWPEDFRGDFWGGHHESRRFSGDDYLKVLLFRANPVIMPSVMVTRDVAEKVGPFSDALHYLIDLDWWRRILAHGDAYWIREPLVGYRMHAHNVIYGMEPGQFARETYTSLLAFIEQHPDAAARAGLTREHLEATVRAWIPNLYHWLDFDAAEIDRLWQEAITPR